MAPSGGGVAGGLDEEDADMCEALGLTPALFWGICDVKYDPRLPEGERVKVLELGDGRTSRFSHHGVATREKFRNEYCLGINYLKLDVLMENKQLTHDRFVSEGYAFLRPRAACYPRQYEQDLAATILKDLAVQEGEAVVLKLCNRNRGAGVVVALAGQLDGALRKLLSPPQGAELEALLARREELALQQEPSGDFEEQCLHWWSNEYPCFLAEACCHSLPVADGGASGEQFDGTLRVAFAMRRPEQEEWFCALCGTSDQAEWDPSVCPHCHGKLGAGREIDWLGGYWKLPRGAAGSSTGSAAEAGQDTSLEAVRARVVSSFSGAEKRTAEVDAAHLEEVYAALSPALQRVLRVSGAIDVQTILADYKPNPLVRAFLVARSGATMRKEKMRQALSLLNMASDIMQRAQAHESRGLPERSVKSYIERNLAVCSLMDSQLQMPMGREKQAKRGEALSRICASLRALPTNATTLFVQGRLHHDSGEWQKGAVCMRKAIALDPDYKQSYLALGNCLLRLGDNPGAAQASRACLRRHADSPTAQYNLGQACYHMLRAGDLPQEDVAEALKLAGDALSFAKVQELKTWRQPDEHMLAYLLAEDDSREKLVRVAVRTRKVFGWRP